MLHRILTFVFWIILGTVTGAALAFYLYFGAEVAFEKIIGEKSIFAVTENFENIEDNLTRAALEDEFFYKPLLTSVPEIPQSGKYVHADLNSMTLFLYEDGENRFEIPIVSKGRPGSFWETPTGEYRVFTKEENHFSSIGEVWMPYSMGFFGNFFIHGWPMYPRGALVPRGFSGGCIRLLTKDAKTVFEFVEKNTPIAVTEDETSLAETRHYIPIRQSNPQQLSAEAFIAGDLDNNFVFLEKKRAEPRSIASITKLMTAVIALESINQDRIITILDEDLDIHGDTGNLALGEEFTIRDLYAPLLLSSSNDAAYAIARTLGTGRFVQLMNEKAQAIGLENTSFTDPSGLQLENRSTPEESILLLKYIRDVHAPLLEITKKSQIQHITSKTAHAWHNFNWKSDDDEFAGGKIGYTDASERTMAALFRLPMSEFAKRDIGVVVLGSKDEEGDVKKIVDWLKSNFVYGNTTMPASPFRITSGGYSKNKAWNMLFVGDIMMDRGIRKIVEEKGGGNYAYIFEKFGDGVSKADLAFGNLEGPISDKGSKQGSIYSFRMGPDALKTLYDVGFDVFSLANNHMGDFGRVALEDTLRRLRRADITYAGAGWNKAEAYRAKIIERAGQRIGLLAFSDVGPAWLKTGDTLSGIAIAAKEDVINAVRQSKDRADIIIVSFHFGEEYENRSRSRQRELAHAAVDAGAKLVIGHHPHVPQEIEEYNGGLIAYSLGNFVFDQAFSEDTKKGMLLKIFMKGSSIERFEPITVVFNENFQPEIKQE